jgi:RNA chaperone Hfq
MSVQDKFLANNMGKDIHIYTLDKCHIRGILLSFDAYTILISYEGQKGLIYKSGIVSITEEDNKE